MKRQLVIISLLVMAVIITLYLLIPTNHNFTYQTTVNCTEPAVARQITDINKWDLWWPGQKTSETIYSYKDHNYKIEKVLLNGFEATVYNNKDSVKGTLNFIFHGTDSTQFQWTSSAYSFSANPIKRFGQYLQLRKIKNSVEDLLRNLKKYFDSQENVYGMKIVKQKVTESSLISTKQTFRNYPSTEEIYSMINSVKEYIHKKGGEESSYPMLNVHREGDGIYQTMVAIPTKTELPSEGNFHLKKMVLGNILMAEVKGGIYTVIKGEQELTNYVNDYKKIAPAIPFQSLVTNRLSETDTSKWITRLHYPIFQ